VDEVIEDLIVELKSRDIYDCVNIIIVSDHGMTTYNSSKLFFIQDHIPEGYNVSYPNYGVNMNININDGDNAAVQAIYDVIQNISETPFQAFYLNDLPLRLHVGRHNPQRFGDIFLVGDLGSYVTYKKTSRPPLGEHGYDNKNVEMQSIFVAHGPAFKEGYQAPGFDNIQIYNLLCALLNITPSANNGTTGALNHMLKTNVAAMLPQGNVQHVTDKVKDAVVECLVPHEDTSWLFETCFCLNASQIDPHNSELLSHNEVKMYQSVHLPLGVPRGGKDEGGCLLTNRHSVTLYSSKLHIPLWVAFTITNESDVSGDGDTQCYQRDPRTSTVQCSDYNTTQSDYTLTHLAPSIGGTFLPLLSNAVPQLSQFYEVVWSEWEQQLKQWAAVYGTLHVITGSVLDTDHNGIRDTDNRYNQWLNGNESVAIPSGFFSIVIRCVDAMSEPCPASSVYVLGVLLPHRPLLSDSVDIRQFLLFHHTTVQDLESITGVNFFPSLSPEQQTQLKLQISPVLWQ
jgi:ectonucleotide pyrophosphatase/phosphodiesterase family protein 1/3